MRKSPKIRFFQNPKISKYIFETKKIRFCLKLLFSGNIDSNLVSPKISAQTNKSNEKKFTTFLKCLSIATIFVGSRVNGPLRAPLLQG